MPPVRWCERIVGVEALELVDFLGGLPLFADVLREELEAAAHEAETATFPAGSVALAEDGPPSACLYVVRSGSMELLSGDDVFALLGPGEAFGHLSLLTRMPPTATVRAAEETVCFLLPADFAHTVFGRPSGSVFASTTLRERLGRRGYSVRALPEIGALGAEMPLSTSPVIVARETPIRDVARAMTEGGSTTAVVRTGGGFGLAGDADLRAQVATGEVSVDEPVSSVMHFPAPTVPRGELGAGALVGALLDPLGHVVVLDDAGEPESVFSITELLSVRPTTPFALRQTLLEADDEEAVAEAAGHIDEVFQSLLAAHLSCADVGRVLTFLADAATTRLLDLAFDRHGPAPVSWAWLTFGSAARREFTLTSDQDNALAYGDEADEQVDAYFERVAADVNAGLARCGFKRDGADVLASDKRWRMTKTEWLDELRTSVASTDRSHLVRAAISADFRQLAGDLELVPALQEIFATANRHPAFLRRVARTATQLSLPLNFRGSFAVERHGDAAGKIDIKAGGMKPITNVARFYTLQGGGTSVATLERLHRAKGYGELPAHTAEALRDAFDITWRVRLEHHAAQREAGVEVDDLVDPDDLPVLAREELRDALRTVRAAQNKLEGFLPSRR
jgi:CBS domain-containing protein